VNFKKFQLIGLLFLIGCSTVKVTRTKIGDSSIIKRLSSVKYAEVEIYKSGKPIWN